MAKIHFNTAFESMTEKDINTWIVFNRKRLVGSAIFTCNDSFTSKVIRWAENWGKKDKEKFTPSHTGSIVEKDGETLIFDMKPPRATTQSLETYLWTTKENFVLVLRDFELDTKMFSETVLDHVGQGYPYMSAIRSVFNKRATQWANHCSELHLRKLQMQGLFTGVNAEITPDELLHLFCSSKAE